MEFGARELLIALGAIVVIAILFDGVRRLRRSRYSKIRSPRRKQPVFTDDDIDDYGSELPSGPARVVSIRDTEELEQFSEELRKTVEANKPKLTSFERYVAANKAAQQSEETDVLILANAVSVGDEDIGEIHPESEESIAESDLETVLKTTKQSVAVEPIVKELEVVDVVVEQAKELELELALAPESELEPEPLPTSETAPVPVKQKPAKLQPINTPEQTDLLMDLDEESAKSESKNSKTKVDRAEVIVFHVMAKKGLPFSGQVLLDALIKEGLRYGSMKIFHRHERKDGSGGVLFSMANTIEPGTFDLNKMATYSTSGVSFFIDLSSVKEPIEAFALMLEAIATVIEDLGGILQDETRSTATRQTIEHYRQRVKGYARRTASTVE